MRTISNSDDIIDSRDVIARIEELEGERDSFEVDCETCEGAGTDQDKAACANCDGSGKVSGSGQTHAAWTEENTDDAAELVALKAFAEEGENCSDWTHGGGMIRDSYFETYAEQLADDIGAIKADAGWPMSFIDWEAAAEALKQDYTSAEFDGVTYWGRS